MGLLKGQRKYEMLNEGTGLDPIVTRLDCFTGPICAQMVLLQEQRKEIMFASISVSVNSY